MLPRALLVPLAAALLVAPALAQDDASPFDVGDHWDYALRPESPNATGSSHRAVVGEHEEILGGERVRALDVVDNTAYTAGNRTVNQTTTQVMRASDGALLSQRLPNGNVTTYNPPCVLPQGGEVGGGWFPACFAGGAESLVVARENITVPAGTFEALVIETSLNGRVATTYWWSEKACWFVRVQSGPRSAHALGYELASFRCKASGASFGEPQEKRGVGAPVLAAPAALGLVAIALRRRRRSAPGSASAEAPS